MVRETGRGNRMVVLNRDKTDVSYGGGINDKGKYTLTFKNQVL